MNLEYVGVGRSVICSLWQKVNDVIPKELCIMTKEKKGESKKQRPITKKCLKVCTIRMQRLFIYFMQKLNISIKKKLTKEKYFQIVN